MVVAQCAVRLAQVWDWDLAPSLGTPLLTSRWSDIFLPRKEDSKVKSLITQKSSIQIADDEVLTLVKALENYAATSPQVE